MVMISVLCALTQSCAAAAVLPQNATQQQIYSTIANDFMEDVVDGCVLRD